MKPFVTWRYDTVHAAGATLARYTAGSSAPGADVVFLLHGLGHWAEGAWSPLVARLDPARRYVAVDLPGFGASDKPRARYDPAYFRAAIEDVARELGTERYALAGHSLGGLLAADHAGTHPERVSHLALIAPAGFRPAPRVALYALASGIARGSLAAGAARAAAGRFARAAVHDPRAWQPGDVERLAAQAGDPRVRAVFAGIYAAGLRALFRRRHLAGACGRFTGPVWCGWGAHDRFLPLQGLDAVRAVYPQCESLVLTESAHLPMIEEPARVAAAVEAFLTSHPF